MVAAFFAATGRDGASRVPGLFPARANPGHVLLSEVNPSPSLLLPGLNRGPENVGPDHSDFSGGDAGEKHRPARPHTRFF